MTGVCGGVAEGGRRSLRELAEALHRFGDEIERRAVRADAAVSLVSHHTASQPVEAADGTLLWCWGQVYGHGTEYQPRREVAPTATPAEYCRDIYDRDGFDTVATLNGEYAIVAYHPNGTVASRDSGGRISLVTDRLGTHPIYWTRTDDGDVVFCSSLQILAAHPGVSVAFDREILYEYFAFRRTFGLRTPLEGVALAHPGAITTIDCASNAVDTSVYWRPEHQATARDRGAARQEYVDRFRAAVADREGTAGGARPVRRHRQPREPTARENDEPLVSATSSDGATASNGGRAVERTADGELAGSTEPTAQTGVLVSGGNDSRAIVAALDAPPVGFHVTSDESAVETQVARRVLDVAEAETRILHRDSEYLADSLEPNASLCDFGSWFNQAHVYEFAEELRSSCDLLFTGLYGDVYSGGTLPSYSVPTPLGRLPLPLLDRPESIEEYLGFYLDGTLDKHSHRLPDYCRSSSDARGVLAGNIGRVDGEIDHHGVRYGDLTDLLFASIYPVTNRHSFLFYASLCQTMPATNPHFDYRLLDWILAQPLGRLLRTDVQNAVIRECSPELAEIPHAARGVAPRRSFPVQYASHRLQGGRRRIRTRLSHSETRGVGFTTDLDELLRSRPLVHDCMRRKRDVVDRYDWLDPAGIRSEYRAHCEGSNRRSELLCLLTFLAMPIHEHVSLEDRTDVEVSAE
ncbi:hypothetical protein [Salinarchaeum laminariae]|uniref:hypothetical protein n=1 Tax=Salinarchaeum laminariae TaxID=869888 RepID=UPI0020C134EE|nr:hypothetical protein [Salinarchaeum laminariae]